MEAKHITSKKEEDIEMLELMICQALAGCLAYLPVCIGESGLYPRA